MSALLSLVTVRNGRVESRNNSIDLSLVGRNQEGIEIGLMMMFYL